jgi:hypothetical protein
MACAKCDFYLPKASTSSLLLEGKRHLLILLWEIPLGKSERVAVEDASQPMKACSQSLRTSLPL